MSTTTLAENDAKAGMQWNMHHSRKAKGFYTFEILWDLDGSLGNCGEIIWSSSSSSK